jgi:hypothetical protein
MPITPLWLEAGWTLYLSSHRPGGGRAAGRDRGGSRSGSHPYYLYAHLAGPRSSTTGREAWPMLFGRWICSGTGRPAGLAVRFA